MGRIGKGKGGTAGDEHAGDGRTDDEHTGGRHTGDGRTGDEHIGNRHAGDGHTGDEHTGNRTQAMRDRRYGGWSEIGSAECELVLSMCFSGSGLGSYCSR
jgi:hypothetical protein